MPSFIWDLSLGLGFVKYWLVIWVLSFCLGFFKYGWDLSLGLSYMGWFFGVCHFVWGLSNMGGICHRVCRHIYAAQMGHSETLLCRAVFYLGFVTWIGVCQIWVGYLEFVTWIGVCQIWAGFVTYGVKKDSVRFCHIWVNLVRGFVIYGQYSAAATFYEQWEVRLG